MILLLWAAAPSELPHYSSGMNNLTPEPRPDINGKVTTRWVRSTPATVNKALLSAPPVAPAVSTQPVTGASVPLLSETLNKLAMSGEHFFDVTAMNPLAVRRIEDQLLSAERISPLHLDIAQADFIGVLESAHEDARRWGRAENSSLIHNFAVLGFSNGEDPDYLVEGLRKFSEFSNVNDFLLDIPEESQQRAAALYKVTVSVENHYLDMEIYSAETVSEDEDIWADYDDGDMMNEPNYIKLKDDELAHYIMDNHTQADEIIKVIRERGADLGLIKEVLGNNAAPAMGSGIL